ncbi:MAG: hypothetical protein ACYDHH_31565 [Solirubrobacteraceae bacterium]
MLAAEKDRGFDVGIFVEMLNRFGRLRRDEFDLDGASYERLVETVASWRVEALALVDRDESPEER